MKDLKLGVGSFDFSESVSYADKYQISSSTRPRISVTTASSYVDLVKSFVAMEPGPFWVLYVHVVSRCSDFGTGRYQSPFPIEKEELIAFLLNYKDFIENDGRHNLWIAASESNFQLVYDRHNVVYLYGDTVSFVQQLTEKGFEEDAIEVPVPHVHSYHSIYDGDFLNLMKEYEWTKSDLREEDER